jgi:hypothetical protein
MRVATVGLEKSALDLCLAGEINGLDYWSNESQPRKPH